MNFIAAFILSLFELEVLIIKFYSNKVNLGIILVLLEYNRKHTPDRLF